MPKANIQKFIHLWFGEDDFTVSEKIKEKKKTFEKEFGKSCIRQLDWQNYYVKEEERISFIQDSLMSDSLFGGDKLAIFKGILFSKIGGLNAEDNPLKNLEDLNLNKTKYGKKSRKEEIILKYLDSPRINIELFFIEKEEPDKRGSIYKKLSELGKKGLVEIKEFSTPSGVQFENWINKKVETLGGKIDREAVLLLAVFLGRDFAQKNKKKKIVQSFDLWEANNEIGKLTSYCQKRAITKADVELLVASRVDMNIFKLIDSISLKNKDQAARLLNLQIEKGLNENYVLTMIIYQFRNLLKIKSLLGQGMFSSEIAAKTGMHPYIVQKNVQQCKSFEIGRLKKIYKKLYDADAAIKTGKMEPRLVLDLLAVSI